MKPISLLLTCGIAVCLSNTSLSAKNNVLVSREVPFGNAANIKVEPAGELTTIRFSADPHGGPESLWFCFRVTQSRSSRPLGILRLILESPETMLGGGRPADFRPVFRLLNGDWQRTGAPEIMSLPDGRQQAAWTITSPKRAMDFAFSYPYGQEDVQQLVRETGSYWRVDTIGVSQAGRPILRLSNDYGDPQARRPGVYLLARQHSGEVRACQ